MVGINHRRNHELLEPKETNAPAQKLFKLVEVKRKDEAKPPRSFEDYEVTLGECFAGVEMIEML